MKRMIPKVSLLCILALCLILQHTTAQVPPAIEWQRIYGGSDGEEAWCLIQTSNGGYALTGSIESGSAGGRDFGLLVTDKNGIMQWNKTYGGTNNDWAYSVVQTSDGGYAMVGETRSFGLGDWDFWLVKTNSTGHMEWNKTYGGAAVDVGHSIVQVSDGGYALAGQTESFGNGGAGCADLWLVRTDSNGNHLWNRTYGGVCDEDAWSMVQTSDGGFALGGFTESFGVEARDFYLVKVNSNGIVEWNRTYGGLNCEHAWDMIQTSDGGYAMTGSSDYGSVTSDTWFVKTDSSGNEEWNKTYGGTKEDYSHSIIQTNNGEYALAGWSMSYGAGVQDAWFVKTDSIGNLQWNKTYGGVSDDAAFSLIQTDDQGYAMAGYTASFGAGISDFWLIKLAPEISWEYIFEDPCRGTTLKISTDDKLFQFIAPDKTFLVKHDPDMILWKDTIAIWYRDSEMIMFTTANTQADFCFTYVKDKQTYKSYLLFDRSGIE